MKTFRCVVLFLAVVMAPAARGQSGSIRVYAYVDTSSRIYEGDQFVYQIVIDGGDGPGEVDLGPLKPYDPRPLGTRNYQTIIGNRMSVRYGMNYALTAREAGSLQLPAIEVKVKGKTYKTQPLTVQVVKAAASDKFSLTVELGAGRCYVGQPLPLTVRWFRGTDFAGIGEFNIDVPFLSNGLFTVEDTPDGAAARKNCLINGEPVTLYERQTRHDGFDAIERFFSKVLIPNRAGTMRLEPATVAADVAVGYTRRRSNDPIEDFFGSSGFFGQSLEFQRYAAKSEPITMEVLDLPAEGRPDDFSGLVGQYTISATAAPTAVNVGDPITLTIRIGGSPYLKPVQQPDLAAVGGFADCFKVSPERDSGTVEDGAKVFRQMLRATQESVSEIPPIPLSYFDAEKGKYVTVHSDSIKLDVAATQVLTSADVQSAGFTPVGRSIEAVQTGLSAHFEGLEVLKNQSFSPLAALIAPGYALLWGGPLALLAVSLIARATMHDTPEKMAAARRRTALRNGMRAAKLAARRSGPQRCEGLAAAMKQYAADKFNRAAKSLTAMDCYGLISEALSNPETAAAYRDVIERCEASSYSGLATPEAMDVKKAIELMRAVDRGLR